jgi:hypothetical protein
MAQANLNATSTNQPSQPHSWPTVLRRCQLTSTELMPATAASRRSAQTSVIRRGLAVEFL